MHPYRSPLLTSKLPVISVPAHIPWWKDWMMPSILRGTPHFVRTDHKAACGTESYAFFKNKQSITFKQFLQKVPRHIQQTNTMTIIRGLKIALLWHLHYQSADY